MKANKGSSTTSAKKRREMDATVICIDQMKKSVQVESCGFRTARGPPSNSPAAHDDLAFVTLPLYPPELNPGEVCWEQLQATLSTASDTVLDQLLIPEVNNYRRI
jgi:hypothetical protein